MGNQQFWEGGPGAHIAGLKQEYHSQLAELRTKLAECFQPSRRVEIEEEIASLKSDYRANLRGVDRNIH